MSVCSHDAQGLTTLLAVSDNQGPISNAKARVHITPSEILHLSLYIRSTLVFPSQNLGSDSILRSTSRGAV